MSAPGFRASPDGSQIAFNNANNLQLLERASGKIVTIVKQGDGGREDGYSLIGWSANGKKFWFGAGNTDSWSKLGLLENGKVKWLPYVGASNDEDFEPNLGLLVTSDAPFLFDSESTVEFKKSKQKTYLTVFEVLTSKKVLIAEAIASRFSPAWLPDGRLQYELDGKIRYLSIKKIQKMLK